MFSFSFSAASIYNRSHEIKPSHKRCEAFFYIKLYFQSFLLAVSKATHTFLSSITMRSTFFVEMYLKWINSCTLTKAINDVLFFSFLLDIIKILPSISISRNKRMRVFFHVKGIQNPKQNWKAFRCMIKADAFLRIENLATIISQFKINSQCDAYWYSHKNFNWYLYGKNVSN